MSRRFLRLAILACWFSVLASSDSAAQQPVTGVPPLSSIASGPFDSVNLANLNVHFSIPVFSRPGKGISFVYNLTYDSLVWMPTNSSGQPLWTPVTNWGWTPQSTAITGHLEYAVKTVYCGKPIYGYTRTEYGPFTYVDPGGTRHPFLSAPSNIVWDTDFAECGTPQVSLSERTSDGSGLLLQAWVPGYGTTTVTAIGGTVFTPPANSDTAGSVSDPNHNTITTNSGGVITDTLGTTTLTVTGTNPVIYSYTAPSGGTGAAQVKVNYSTYNVATHFTVSGIGDYYFPAGNPTQLVSSITLPDNTQYTFTYEPTPGGSPGTVTGRIASVTLPTQGTISYSYADPSCANNPSSCMMADGSPTTLTRGLSGGTWTYARALQPNQSNAQQTWTAITDPAGNITDAYFSGIYPTMKKVYQGVRTTVLDYSYICYDGATQNCAQAVLNLATYRTERTAYDYPNNGSFYSKQDVTYDQYGNMTAETYYDYATSGNAILHKIVRAYNAPTLCSTYNICDHPSSIQVQDGASVSRSYTTFAYDEGGTTLGSVTTISRSKSGLTSGPFLTQHYSYYSGGTLATATDPNLTVTTYNYTSGSCNYAFPASVTVNNLITSYVYNCTGGVVTSGTDPNGKNTSASYTADHYFWRPESTTDQSGNPTQYSYYPTLSIVGQVESIMNYGSSTTDVLTTPDNLGRPYLQQTREGPSSGNWDTVQLTYDTSGRTQYVSRPFVSTAGNGGSGEHRQALAMTLWVGI